MPSKTEAIVVLVLIAGIFAGGAYVGWVLHRPPPQLPAEVQTVKVIQYVKVQTETKRVVVASRKTVTERSGRVTVTETKVEAQQQQVTQAVRQSEGLANNTEAAHSDAPLQTRWHVSALVAADGPRLLNGEGLHFSFGAHVERRVLGPIYLGAFGLSNGTVGASLGVAW